MFGISLSEFLLILVILVAVTNPKDIPGIAKYLAKIFFKAKDLLNGAKNEMQKISKEIGLEELKKQAEAEIRKEQEELKKTIIIDMYGNEHEVYDVARIRGDLPKEDLEAEIEKHNEANKSLVKSKEETGPEKIEKNQK